MLTRRAMLSLPPALAALAAPRRALAEPRLGQGFPAFSVRDLNDRSHSHRELANHRTFVTAITGTGASEGMRHWLNNAEARHGRGGPIVALVALALPFIAWDGIVRSQARARTPQWRWSYVWLDRDGVLQRALGLAHDNNVPWAFVVERNGTVSAATHAPSNHPTAQAIWAAMAAP